MSATNTNCIFRITDLENAKKKVLSWANRFSIFCFLDNHRYQTNYHSVECLLAIGSKQALTGHSITDLQNFLNGKPAWRFGHLSYDLKNDIEGLQSTHAEKLGFPDIFFFEPTIVIRLSENEMKIEAEAEAEVEAEKIFHEIMDA